MTKFRNWHSEKQPLTQVDFGISQTVPDQSLSMKLLLQRAMRGQDINSHPGAFENNQDFSPTDLDNLERLDKIERIELTRKMKQKAKRISDDITESRAQAKIKEVINSEAMKTNQKQDENIHP